jgi:hypothetical protein
MIGWGGMAGWQGTAHVMAITSQWCLVDSYLSSGNARQIYGADITTACGNCCSVLQCRKLKRVCLLVVRGEGGDWGAGLLGR